MIKLRSIVMLCLGLLIAANVAKTQSLEEIQREIQLRNAAWIASENSVSRRTQEQRRRLCGARLDRPEHAKVALIELDQMTILPEALDWRNHNGNWLTPVRDQADCGSCWAFGAVAQVESWMKIHLNNSEEQVDLSEQILISCTNGSCASGGRSEEALEYIRTDGIPVEACLPYQARDGVFCETECPALLATPVTIPGWGYVSLDEANVETIKNAVARHPVTASFEVYADFFFYSSGVYEHIWGEYEGGHAILIVGWDDTEQSWVCKNSWGANWGQGGYFRIKWGQCEIGEYIPFVWDSVMGGPALSVSNSELNLTVEQGESQTTHLILTNDGSGKLEYSTVDYIEQLPPNFHTETSGAWDDFSFWNGDPEIGGYDDYWRQVMDLPPIDLSTATHPELRFMISWAIEPPVGASAPYDGWDGTNVWCSVDGGDNFNPLIPLTPPYTCQSLWSFGGANEGWNMGPGVPGWAGSSGGWTQAIFDLSNFKMDNVIIRFEFASDLAYSSPNNSSINGVFLDEILILDGDQTLTYLDGTITAGLDLTSFGGENGVVDWLNLENSGGIIESGMNTAVEITVDTDSLDVGNYSVILYISSNDASQSEIKIPVNLEVTEATSSDTDSDLKNIPGMFHLNPAYPNPFNGSVTVSWQLRETSPIQVDVYDLKGRHIQMLWKGEMQAGFHQSIWKAEDASGTPVSSGVYLIQAKIGSEAQTRKAILVQ